MTSASRFARAGVSEITAKAGITCEATYPPLLMDIGTDEVSHLEVVGALAHLHLKPIKFKPGDAEGLIGTLLVAASASLA